MAQPTGRVLTPEQMEATDYRNQFVENVTDATDFATADSSLVISTIPFLPAGDSFDDVPLYPVGICQSFSYNEGLQGQFIPEIGSSRKIGGSGSTMGSGQIQRLSLHGNSLLASLYRPTVAWIKASKTLSKLLDKFSGENANWISGVKAQDISLFDESLDNYVQRVIAAGGLNSPLFKVPFGLLEIRRDPRQRVTAINYLEQCSLRGDQAGLSAGQFQIAEAVNFEYERKRPLKGIGPFVVSSDTLIGINLNDREE